MLECAGDEVELQRGVAGQHAHVGLDAVGGAIEDAAFGVDEGIGRVAVAVREQLLEGGLAVQVTRRGAQAHVVIEGVVEQCRDAVHARIQLVEIRVAEEGRRVQTRAPGRCVQRGRDRQELLAGGGLVALVAGQHGEVAALAAPADRRRDIDAVIVDGIGLHAGVADHADHTTGNGAGVVECAADVALELLAVEVAELHADFTADVAEGGALGHRIDDAAGGAGAVQHRGWAAQHFHAL
ncbi:hypothetical protein D3C71_1299120 [compost metagenome]